MNKPNVNYEKVLNDNGMPTTEAAIRDKFNAIVKEEGLITNQSRMSPFWRLITAIAVTPVIWIKDILITVVLKNTFLATASGDFLDLFAWAVNIVRKPETAASGVITFYKSDIKQAITLKAGTLIESAPLNGTVYQLRVKAEFTIQAGVLSALVPVEAVNSGAGFNLAPGYYRILPVAVSGISHVVNEDDWLTQPGDDEESDDDLRPRCRNQFNLVGAYHTDAVYRGMISSLIGLNSERIYFVHDAPRGPGTANVYLLLDTGVISEPFITAVNNHIMTDGHHGHGDDLRAFALPDTLHDLDVECFISDGEAEGEESRKALKAGIENLIKCAFRGNADYDVYKTWPYSRFSFSRLGEEIHREFPEVKSVIFSQPDIISDLSVPRLQSLSVRLLDE